MQQANNFHSPLAPYRKAALMFATVEKITNAATWSPAAPD
jgi:hypothetical protein